MCKGPWARKESKINTVLMVRGGSKTRSFLYFSTFPLIIFNRKAIQFGNYFMVTAYS